MGRSEFKFTDAVNINPQVQKMSLVQSNTVSETSTRCLQQILNLLGEYKKNTSCSDSSLDSRIWLKIDQGILHTRRYMELIAELSPDACTLLHLGTDVRYSYVSIGAKMHSICSLSGHVISDYSASSATTSIGCVGERYFVLTFRLRCPGLSKKNLKKRSFRTLFWTVRFRLFLNDYRTNRHKTWHALPVGTYVAGLIVQCKLSSLPGTSGSNGHNL